MKCLTELKDELKTVQKQMDELKIKDKRKKTYNKCKECEEKQKDRCNHCFKCCKEDHIARNCPTGKENRLLQTGQ